mmetsp:Transcript_1354/g.4100  ORF Transcript_1354/g.4100 Transcript_1354/m.4100 type:complete len:395 (+) Transcript_1354:69-1253(+)
MASRSVGFFGTGIGVVLLAVTAGALHLMDDGNPHAASAARQSLEREESMNGESPTSGLSCRSGEGQSPVRCIRLPSGSRAKAFLVPSFETKLFAGGSKLPSGIDSEFKKLVGQSRKEWTAQDGTEAVLVLWDSMKQARGSDYCQGRDKSKHYLFRQHGFNKFYHAFIVNSQEGYARLSAVTPEMDLCEKAAKKKMIMNVAADRTVVLANSTDVAAFIRNLRAVYVVDGDPWSAIGHMRMNWSFLKPILEQVSLGHLIYVGSGTSAVLAGHNVDLMTEGRHAEKFCGSAWRDKSDTSYFPDDRTLIWQTGAVKDFAKACGTSSPSKTPASGLGNAIFGRSSHVGISIVGPTQVQNFQEHYGKGWTVLSLSSAPTGSQAGAIVVAHGEVRMVQEYK